MRGDVKRDVRGGERRKSQNEVFMHPKRGFHIKNDVFLAQRRFSLPKGGFPSPKEVFAPVGAEYLRSQHSPAPALEQRRPIRIVVG